MTTWLRIVSLIAPSLTICCAQIPDLRHISNGLVIPDESYSDQPYIVKTDEGAWLCAMTTGSGVEGAGGQHIISLRSMDLGKTWSSPVAVEPADGPEASYAVLLKIPSGRIYVFYNHNTDNVRSIIGDNPPYKNGQVTRVDSQGHFVFKYSDDHGRTWSAKRYEISQRDFEIDRRNPYAAKIKFFWNVGRAFSLRGSGYVPLYKVGGFGEGFFTSSEGVLLRSPNILTEKDPQAIRWETLPDGDIGIRTPTNGGGPIAEEQSFSVLSDGSIFCVFRTIDGYSAHTYSRDGGRSWEPTEYMRYADGRPIKHPRAANFAWRCENGKFLYWFHNHGGRFIRDHPNRRTMAYDDRNPVWLAGGVETDSPRGKVIRWSQPEIALYDDDPFIRMSYPDLIEDRGKYYVTETQKEIARVHELDRGMLEGLWNQASAQGVAQNGLVLSNTGSAAREAALPALPQFLRRVSGGHGTNDLRSGITFDVWASCRPGEILLDNRTSDGRGFVLRAINDGAVELALNDGRSESRWTSDPNVIEAGTLHHIAAIIDAGPKIISFVVDGRLNDGGDSRQFGWGRFNPNLRSIDGTSRLRIGDRVRGVRIYDRALRISEVIAAYHAQ